MKTTLTARDLALVLAVVVIWGFNFVPIRWALDEVPPFALASLRFFLASVPAIFFVARPAMTWRHIGAYGVAIGCSSSGCCFSASSSACPRDSHRS